MLRLIVSAAVALWTGSATARPVSDLADGRSGSVEFASITPSGPTQLIAGEGTPTVIRGTLALPSTGQGRVPAMVIAHGSGGIMAGREGAWSERLLAQGVATFIVDSFGPRGIASTGADQSQLPTPASAADALSALKLLASHPGIDPARIGVMGFSKGGQVALYTALEPFRKGVITGDLRFALHVALYPSCSLPYIAKAVTGAPVLFLTGAADDYTPASHCERYVDWFRRMGADARMITYAGAHHGFDVPRAPQHLSRVQSARDCRMDIELDPVVGRLWDSGTTVPNEAIGDQVRGCMVRGATFGGDPTALAQAIEEVRSAVERTLLR